MNLKIYNSELKRDYVLNIHNKIAVSISGGSDSDIVLDLISKYEKRPDQEIEYIFFNTGLEYKATFDHIKYLEQKYNIEIKQYKPKKPIPLAVKQHGEPFLSKHASDMIQRLQKHGFDWKDESCEVLLKKYPKCEAGVKWWTNKLSENGQFNIDRNKYLKEFMIENPPTFSISKKCCQYAKKDLSKQYIKENSPDLMVVGVRKSEGGQRSGLKTCFNTGGEIDMYYPILHYDDQDKLDYEFLNNITHSKCYTEYGLKRTGCAGCPYGRNFESELFAIDRYEPNLSKAVNTIFKNSYEYTRKYREFVESKNNGFIQLNLFNGGD